jgi:hypothetical protein
MAVKRPTLDQLQEVAYSLGIHLSEEQAENFRKMLLAMARDIRVLLVKLCDRTHNMRTLEYLSEARRQRIAQETMDIYAPLAHRLGIYWMKSELEDLSFRYTKPEFYEEIKNLVNKNRKERERYIEDVCKNAEGNTWLYVWAEDKNTRHIVQQHLEYIGAKITTFGEIYSVYFKEGVIPRSFPKVDPVEKIAIKQLNIPEDYALLPEYRH